MALITNRRSTTSRPVPDAPLRSRLHLLSGILLRFDEAAAVERLSLLRALANSRPEQAREVLEWHRILQFLRAYPRNRDELLATDCAAAELRKFLGKISAQEGNPLINKLANTGLPYTKLYVSLSLHLVSWLASRFPDDVGLHSLDASRSVLEQVLCCGILPVERELIQHRMLADRAMFARLMKPGENRLQFLVRVMNAMAVPDEMKEVLWESLKVFIAWKMGSDTGLPSPGTVFYHRKPLLKSFDFREVIFKPLKSAVVPTAVQQEILLAKGRQLLATLLRETDPVTYAEPGGISRISCGRGIEIILYPMQSSYRLPLESYIGYIAYKNGMPVAYGGGWVFLHRSKIGINILPAFRGGESSFLFSQILRVYHQVFQVYKFIVEPYQVGKNNMDGIRSGAYWFYFRLQFLSVSSDLQRLAEQEFQRIRNEKGYRSPVSVMKKLATCNLELNLFSRKNYPDADPLQLSQDVNEWISRHFNGNRSEAIAHIKKRMAAWNKKHGYKLPPEVIAENLYLVALSCGGILKWNEKQNKRFQKWITLKSQGTERAFIEWSQRYWPLLFGMDQHRRTKTRPPIQK